MNLNSNDIVFDENLEFYTSFGEANNDICVVLSDDLKATEEDLTDEYKTQISEFINDYAKWHEKVFNAVNDWSRKKYCDMLEDNHAQLLNIFILFEQGERELYGLEFAIDCDIEHGCGLKISKDGYKIIEIGTADTAFC